MEFPLPLNLTARETLPDRTEWIATLPSVISDLRLRWSLDIGDPFQPGGETAWVAPASSAEYGEVVLKVAWRHDDMIDESKGLRVWDGDGAVRILDSLIVNDSSTALVLERCFPGTLLSDEPEPYQDTVVAGLLRRLWRRPPFDQPFRPL